MAALEYGYTQIEIAQNALNSATKELTDARELVDEGYEKLERLLAKYGKTL